MSNVTRLTVVENPAKESLLAMIEELRETAEKGEIRAMVVIPIRTNGGWATWMTGDVGPLELAGLLGRAWLDANNSMGIISE